MILQPTLYFTAHNLMRKGRGKEEGRPSTSVRNTSRMSKRKRLSVAFVKPGGCLQWWWWWCVVMTNERYVGGTERARWDY